MRIRQKRQWLILTLCVLCIVVGLFFISCKTFNNKETSIPKAIKHGIVYYEPGNFAGWPANNGVWCWDNEILVGFVQAEFEEEVKGLHTYNPSSAKNKYARSIDGGETWLIEDAFDHGQTAWGFDNNVRKEDAVTPVPLTQSIEDFTDPNFIITFQRHNNSDGPTHFYYSYDKGNKWIGPFSFPNLNTEGVASRTDYLVEGKKELSAFLTVAKSNKDEGRVVLSRTTDGGVNWNIVSWIGEEHEGFDIMSSSVRLTKSELLTVIRSRTGEKQDLLTAYVSKDNGETWTKLKNPVTDTGRGGSPPALVKLEDGRLALGYIYRSGYGSRVNIRFSSDNGRSWSDEIVLRSGDGASRDVGYPRMVQRADGKLVLIYYWNNAILQKDKPYRYIASTIIDPNDWY